MVGPDARRPSGSAVPLSFVVIAYNEEHNLRACLDAIEAQDGLGAHEIVVVDDGSTDGTAAAARAAAAQSGFALCLVEQPNRGRGAARAAGVAAASATELVAMVDGDIVLPPDWLAICEASLEGEDAVGGVAVPDGDVTYVSNRFGLVPTPAPATTTITGNNGLYRRAVFDAVGFDERLREGEDVAFNHELATRGYRLRCLPDLHVRHNEEKTYAESLRWLYESGQGATRQLLRYRRLRTPDLAFAGFAAVVAAALALARRTRPIALVPVPLYLLLVSDRHLRAKFDRSGPLGARLRYGGAVVVDASLVLAYFAGRASGLPKALRGGPLDNGASSRRQPWRMSHA